VEEVEEVEAAEVGARNSTNVLANVAAEAEAVVVVTVIPAAADHSSRRNNPRHNLPGPRELRGLVISAPHTSGVRPHDHEADRTAKA